MAAYRSRYSGRMAVLPGNWTILTMHDFDEPMIAQVYRSKRTGRQLTVTAIEGDLVYYQVDGFLTEAPLFLPKNKFLHLVGLDQGSGETEE